VRETIIRIQETTTIPQWLRWNWPNTAHNKSEDPTSSSQKLNVESEIDCIFE